MKKLLPVLITLALITSCGGPEPVVEEGEKMVELKGFYIHNDVKEKIYAGGMFRMNEVEDFKNLYPNRHEHVASKRIVAS